MPYIGAKELKASDIRRFDVTSSTSATHTLTWTPPTEQSLIVTINGIKQHEDAYSVSGTTLTLSSPLVATDKLEVIGINDIGTTITPAQNSVNTDKIVDDAVTAAKLNTTGTPSSSTFLRGDMAWATPTDQGKVLQVVQTVKTDTFTTTSSTLTPVTGLSVNITPSSTSSKILLLYTIAVGNSSTSGGVKMQAYRDSTEVYISTGGSTNLSNYLREPGTAGNIWNFSGVYLDSPSTTSSITYSLSIAIEVNGTAVVNRRGGDTSYGSPSNITVMEIAG
jgi:hypothetical protein